ncbi:hypothetical protein DV737_g180, partial [Chaetothyriales sp. CBS 132003]
MSANPATELGSAIQSVSIKQHPSPEHDINPSTAASKKEPVDLLPDFRFEQSYLASIKNAKNNTEVAFITLRDQIVLPLAQGLLWNMVMFGWRYWNRGSKFAGQSLGAKVRKWWWGFNNWKLPAGATQANRPTRELAKGAEEVGLLQSFRWVSLGVHRVIEAGISSPLRSTLDLTFGRLRVKSLWITK